MSKSQAFSPATREAARLLGRQVRLGRLQRRWKLDDLASRVGVSAVTLRKVERGDVSVALGTALEAASIVGVVLYADPTERARGLQRIDDTLALLPSAVRRSITVDDNF